ncbi:MAG: hypothetical protein J7K75_12085 [Desulfuromonas sp.]|nr:hypothetical protein [Desulfuromonas sp.]
MARQYWLSTGGVLLVLMLAMLSGYHYYESRGQALKKIDQRLFAGATALRYSVGDTLHNQWLNPQSLLSEQQRHDAAIRLTQLCNDLKLKDLYTLVKHDGGLYFTISSLTAEELAAEHYPSDFELYENAGPDDYTA